MALTSKELSWIEDQLTLEQLLVSKYRLAASTATDEAIKSKMEKIADRHQQHFDRLLGHLN